MIAMHEDGLAVAEQFERLQPPEHRIDIVRDVWLDQVADTERLLDAFESVQPTTATAVGA